MKKFCLVIIFLIISAASAAAAGEHYPAVYKGVVTIDGLTATSATVSVYDSACNKPPQEFLFDKGSYTLQVAWYDPATPNGVSAGETITFQVNDINARTWTVTEADTVSQTVNLDIKTSAPTPCAINDKNINGGSGGGSGSTVSAETFENILKKESREELLSKDDPRTYSFGTPELPVSQIVIISNINAGLTNVKVELLKNRSALASVDAPGNVYKYLNIWVGSSGFANPRNIKEGVVKFKLLNSWITSNGFADSDIKMLKWNGAQWITLATGKKNSDEKFTYYEANTTSFSPFAISGVKGTQAPAVSPEATAVTIGIPETPAPAPTKKSPGLGIVLAIAGLIAVYLKNRRY